MELRHLALGTLVALSSLSLAQEAAAPSSRRTPGGLQRPIQAAVSHLPVAAQAQLPAALPPLPEGVEELRFTEFFQLPVGPRGLEPSARLKAMDGKRVRLSGFFVFEDWGSCNCPPTPAIPLTPAAARRQRSQPAWMKHVVPGRIMLAPVPVSVSLGHYGLCDDLPPQVAFLEVIPRFGEPVYYRPGAYAVTGQLKLQTKEELDGRTSYVHLRVEREEDMVALATVQAPRAATPAPSAPATSAPALTANPAPAQRR